MTKIYQLKVENEWVNDVYHDEDEARANATQIYSDFGMAVTIWEAEEIGGIPYDALVWSMIVVIGY